MLRETGGARSSYRLLLVLCNPKSIPRRTPPVKVAWGGADATLWPVRSRPTIPSQMRSSPAGIDTRENASNKAIPLRDQVDQTKQHAEMGNRVDQPRRYSAQLVGF